MGEVTFTSERLRERFPALAKLHRDLGRWIKQFEKVSGIRFESTPELDYSLDVSIRGQDLDVFAFPRAARALAEGQYFLSDGAARGSLSKLLRQLRLRGVEGIIDPEPSEPDR